MTENFDSSSAIVKAKINALRAQFGLKNDKRHNWRNVSNMLVQHLENVTLVFPGFYMSIFMPFLPTLDQIRSQCCFFVFQMRKTNRFFTYVLLWKRILASGSSFVYRTSYGIAKILPTNGCFFFFFFPLSQLGSCLIYQMKFICWA